MHNRGSTGFGNYSIGVGIEHSDHKVCIKFLMYNMIIVYILCRQEVQKNVVLFITLNISLTGYLKTYLFHLNCQVVFAFFSCYFWPELDLNLPFLQAKPSWLQNKKGRSAFPLNFVQKHMYMYLQKWITTWSTIY